MANALASTIFAQRMALRERLLNQGREDKQIQDDRKARLIAEMNRSTDLAIQAQGKAIERKSREAMELQQVAGYMDEAGYEFEGESDAVKSAGKVGMESGKAASEKASRANRAKMILEAYKQDETNRRTSYVEGGRNKRASASLEEQQARRGMEEEKYLAEQPKRETDLELRGEQVLTEPVKRDMYSRMPGGAGFMPPPPGQKPYELSEKYLNDQQGAFEAERAKLMAGMGQFTNTAQIAELGEKINSHSVARQKVLMNYLQSLPAGQEALATKIQEQLAILQSDIEKVRAGKMPKATSKAPEAGGPDQSGSGESAPEGSSYSDPNDIASHL